MKKTILTAVVGLLAVFANASPKGAVVPFTILQTTKDGAK